MCIGPGDWAALVPQIHNPNLIQPAKFTPPCMTLRSGNHATILKHYVVTGFYFVPMVQKRHYRLVDHIRYPAEGGFFRFCIDNDIDLALRPPTPPRIIFSTLICGKFHGISVTDSPRWASTSAVRPFTPSRMDF